jgi:hypothetical protein
MSSELSPFHGCKFILRSGPRKNQECAAQIVRNSGYCSRHIRKVKILSFESLSADILLYLAGFMDMISVYQFSSSTNYTRHVFSHSYSDKIWKDSIGQITDPDYNNKPNDTSPQRALQLLANRGCEECGKSRIRKVYWPFAKRLCRRCLEKLTISDYRLKTEYNIPNKFWPTNHQHVHLWNKYVGTYDLRFYLIKDVEVNFGKTLKQIDTEKNEEMKRREKLAEELTKWARSRYSNKGQISRCRTYAEFLERIAEGEFSSLSQFLTDRFISEVEAEYKELRKLEKELARQRRQKTKLYQQFRVRLEECKTRNDYSELNNDLRQSELSFRQKYMIEAEIWSRSKNLRSIQILS